MLLTNSDIKSLRLYITKRYGSNHYRLEPDDILNETVLYLIERNKFEATNIRYIASSTFFAIKNLKRKQAVISKLQSSELLKINETIKEEELSTPYEDTYESELKTLIANYKKPEAGTPKAPVICVSTGEKFNSISDAARRYKIHGSAIRRNINKLCDYAGKYNGLKLVWKDLK
jgi:hypothetical protein